MNVPHALAPIHYTFIPTFSLSHTCSQIKISPLVEYSNPAIVYINPVNWNKIIASMRAARPVDRSPLHSRKSNRPPAVSRS